MEQPLPPDPRPARRLDQDIRRSGSQIQTAAVITTRVGCGARVI